MFLSTDGGTSWKRTTAPLDIVSVMIVRGQLLRVSDDQSGVGNGTQRQAVVDSSPVGSATFSAMSMPMFGGPATNPTCHSHLRRRT